MTSDAPRMFLRRLGVRLALAFAVALLPFGIVSGLQSKSLVDEARARSEAAVLGETLIALAPDANLIRGARVAASALAASMTVLALSPDQCLIVMKKIVETGDYSFAAFVPLDGMAVCTSSGEPLDLRASERAIRLRDAPRADVVVIRNGVASKTSVLAFGNPVFDPKGAYLGYVTISLPHLQLEHETTRLSAEGIALYANPIALLTFDAEGTILTSSTGLDDAPQRLPADMPLANLAKAGTRTFTALSVAGPERVFAVIPLIENTVFALGSWPTAALTGPRSFLFSPYLMPGLMWLASLLVAVMAVERLVTRHIRALRRSITSFAEGNQRKANLTVPDAAIEIEEVIESYLKMTDTILHDEAELEDTVHQREVLLREVHHRVKNNLQLIASIMNMQIRQSKSDEARTLMKGLQERVMSLATIHRGLYQTSGLTDVRADELLTDILRQILSMATAPGRNFHVVTGFDDIALTPDQAVPLSLLLTEALTNAIKYSRSAAGKPPRLEVTLRREGATEAVLSVGNEIASPAPETGSDGGLGSQLMTAFAQQLGGVNRVTVQGDMYRLRLRFPLRALAEAESGHASEVVDLA
jgi:two-component system, sensor histidine kinase PdtaS